MAVAGEVAAVVQHLDVDGGQRGHGGAVGQVVGMGVGVGLGLVLDDVVAALLLQRDAAGVGGLGAVLGGLGQVQLVNAVAVLLARARGDADADAGAGAGLAVLLACLEVLNQQAGLAGVLFVQRGLGGVDGDGGAVFGDAVRGAIGAGGEGRVDVDVVAESGVVVVCGAESGGFCRGRERWSRVKAHCRILQDSRRRRGSRGRTWSVVVVGGCECGRRTRCEASCKQVQRGGCAAAVVSRRGRGNGAQRGKPERDASEGAALVSQRASEWATWASCATGGWCYGGEPCVELEELGEGVSICAHRPVHARRQTEAVRPEERPAAKKHSNSPRQDGRP